jgi:hypothetical protein
MLGAASGTEKQDAEEDEKRADVLVGISEADREEEDAESTGALVDVSEQDVEDVDVEFSSACFAMYLLI